jgi:inosine/guanosine/xanthosine phosphorylase family protein
VLGSGFGLALEDSASFSSDWDLKGELKFSNVPGLVGATAPDHHGVYRYFQHRQSKKSIAFQMGRLHGYEGLPARQVVRTVMLPRMAGTSNFILTNAAGSLRTEWPVGSLMVIRDHVNLTGQNPLLGENPKDPNGKELGPRFPDLSHGYPADLRAKLKTKFTQNGIVTNEGVYLGLLGPNFETPAEIRLFAKWGLDAVGMSTVWESLSLNHSGAKVAGISLLSNLGCGLDNEPLNHDSVLKISRESSKKAVTSLFQLMSEEFNHHG